MGCIWIYSEQILHDWIHIDFLRLYIYIYIYIHIYIYSFLKIFIGLIQIYIDILRFCAYLNTCSSMNIAITQNLPDIDINWMRIYRYGCMDMDMWIWLWRYFTPKLSMKSMRQILLSNILHNASKIWKVLLHESKMQHIQKHTGATTACHLVVVAVVVVVGYGRGPVPQIFRPRARRAGALRARFLALRAFEPFGPFWIFGPFGNACGALEKTIAKAEESHGKNI